MIVYEGSPMFRFGDIVMKQTPCGPSQLRTCDICFMEKPVEEFPMPVNNKIPTICTKCKEKS